jgi:adenylate kinase family enzyme
MEPQTFVFFGRSGCGKGTQAKLLIEKLSNKDKTLPIIYIETGKLIRDFIANGVGFTRDLVKDLYDKGGLQPEFVPVSLWSDYLIKNMTPQSHVVCDGVARRPAEATIFDSTMKFYGRNFPHIILLDVSSDWATERLLARGRSDDDREEIKKRMSWFDENVMPSVKFFEGNNDYHFHKINGENSIEVVHEEIIKAIDLSL